LLAQFFPGQGNHRKRGLQNPRGGKPSFGDFFKKFPLFPRRVNHKFKSNLGRGGVFARGAPNWKEGG